MKFIDLFAGIGGFRSGLEKNGHECIAFCEIDKYARQSYKAMYETKGEEEWHDITKVSNEEFRSLRGQADIITGGFPCQAFSVAGNRRGFEDTRGTLFFHIARAIKEIEPSYVLLENVKGLFLHDKGRTFGTIIQTLDELGYVTEWGLFNSKFWGVPQNRERVYILVTRKDKYDQPKLFDLLKQQTEVNTRLVDVLEDEVDEKFYLSEEKTKKSMLNHYKHKEIEDKETEIGIEQVGNIVENKETFGGNPQRGRVYSPTGLSPTLNTSHQPKVTILGNTSNTGHRSHNIHDVEGLSPTIAARDYKGAKQIAVPRRVSKDFKEIVKVRKYTIDTEKLSQLLKESKSKSGMTSRQIAEKLNVPKTKVEHYFRTDSSFAIPDSEIWEDLKTIIKFDSDEFDTAIHTFVEKESEFDTTNRIYDSNYISPTLNTVNQPKIIQSDTDNDKEKELTVRKLTPLECWRLQSFTDDQFYKAKDDGVSDSQLYKQAGNSVTVNVIDAIVKKL